MQIVERKLTPQQKDWQALREGMLKRGMPLLDKALPHIIVPQVAGELGIKDLSFGAIRPGLKEKEDLYRIDPEKGIVWRVFGWDFEEIEQGYFDPVKRNKQIEIGVHIYSGSLHIVGGEEESKIHGGKLARKEVIFEASQWLGKTEEVVKPAIREAMSHPRSVTPGAMV